MENENERYTIPRNKKKSNLIEKIWITILLISLFYYAICFIANVIEIKIIHIEPYEFLDRAEISYVVIDEVTLRWVFKDQTPIEAALAGPKRVYENFASVSELVLLEINQPSIYKAFVPWFISERVWFRYPDVYDCVKARMVKYNELEQLMYERIDNEKRAKDNKIIEDLYENWQCN